MTESVSPRLLHARPRKHSDVSALEQLTEGVGRASLAEAVMASCPDGTLACNSDGIVLFANGNIVELLGYSRKELIGKNIEIFLPVAMREQHAIYLRQFFSRPHRRAISSSISVVGLRKNGEQIPLSIALSYIETKDGILATAFMRERRVEGLEPRQPFKDDQAIASP